MKLLALVGLIVGLVVGVGLFVQPVFAAPPFIPIFHTGKPGSGPTPNNPQGSWCGPCNVFKAKPDGARIDNLVTNNKVKYNYIDKDGIGQKAGIPALEYAPDKFIAPGESGFDAKLSEIEKAQPPKPAEACIVYVHIRHEKIGEDKILYTNDDIYRYMENIYGGSGDVRFASGEQFMKENNNYAMLRGGPLYVERNGKKVDQGPYQVNGQAPGQDGKYYTVVSTTPLSSELNGGKTPQKPECVFDEKDKGSAPVQPNAGGAQDPFSGLGGNPGSGGGGGGNPGGGGLGGGMGGFAALLPLIMQMMNPQGQGQGQQGLNNQQQQQNCAQQGVFPVCGTDGRTYNNTCWLQQVGVTQKSTGVCASATPTPNVTADITRITTHLAGSGMPQTLVTTIIAGIQAIIQKVSSASVVIP